MHFEEAGKEEKRGGKGKYPAVSNKVCWESGAVQINHHSLGQRWVRYLVQYEEVKVQGEKVKAGEIMKLPNWCPDGRHLHLGINVQTMAPRCSSLRPQLKNISL